MKAKNYLLLTVFLIGFGFVVQAKKVEQKEAQIVAKNHYFEKFNQYKNTLDYNDIVITNIYEKKQDGRVMFYAFDFENGGFVIVSAEDAYYPIIGYSYKGSYPVNASPKSNYGSYMQTYCDMIEHLRDNEIVADEAIESGWEHLSTTNYAELKTERGGRALEPLVDCLWNQDAPYNLECPYDPDGPGDHVYAGCVATAMSMIMYYWRYPLTGTGSHTYYASGYGNQTADFGNTDYIYTGMQNEATNLYPWDIALLQYHCGVSVDMQYSPNGSGAFSSDVDDALNDYFKYDDAYYQQKIGSLDYWASILKTDLDMGYPIYYAGRDQSNYGHAFVCDGYDDDNLFHFNFGWSGSGNGYYALNDVNGYNRYQQTVLQFFPTDPDYPYFAEGADTLRTLSGSITDGSGPIEDYLDNQSASWLIDPQNEEDSVTDITLTFPEFHLASNDQLIIYDGSTTSDPVLGSYSGSTPPGGDLTSTGNQILVTFESDGSDTDEGFYIEYTSNIPEFCSGLVKYFEPTATISDGSGSFNYSNNSGCMFQIMPEYATNITLTFSEFDTEEGKDKVMVYDGSSTLLGTFSGDDIPEPLTATSGSMMIVFNSNPWINSSGWVAEYTIENVNVEENDGFEALTIYPNPASDIIRISFKNTTDENFQVNLMNITGKTVYQQDITEANEFVDTSIDVTNLPDGVYILNIQGNTKSTTKRIIIE